MSESDKERSFLRELVRVNSGQELATITGMDVNEGVVVAVFPESVENVRLGPEFGYAPGITGYPIMAQLGPWGERLLDIATEPPSAVKWWKVKQFAKERGLNLVPERWQGAVVEIPQDYFDKPHILGIRLYNEGPWFWPKESPIVTQDGVTSETSLLPTDAARPAD